MLKLVGGSFHQHSPTGIATKTPSREMEEPLRPFEDMEASPKADVQQGSGSHTYSEGTPPNDWGDSTYTLSPAEKRRKMNRESARRTRQRKQEQTVSLKAEVASLQTHNVCINEQLKSLSDKNQELTADRQKLYEQNNMLIKCVAELSAVCKRKEATLGELRHCIQTADKLTDIPLPPVDQGQLSSQSLEMLCIPQLSVPTMAQPSSCRPDSTQLQPGGHQSINKIDCDPLVNVPAETASHLRTPMQMHDAGSGYLPSQKQPLMTPLHTNSTFSRNPMMASSARTTGTVSIPRSTSLGTMSWVPTVGTSRHANLSAANPFASNGLPANSFNLHNASIASGNSTQKGSNPMQQSRVTQPNPARCASSQTCLRMPRFDFEGNPHCPQGPSAGARQALMIEAAKQQDGFNPKHVSEIVRMTQQMPSVQRAASEPSFFRLTPESRHSEGTQEILGRSFDWKAEGSQHQRLDSSLEGSLGGAITHGPQTSAHEQILEVSTGGFCQLPMQHLDESAGGNHNYGMQ
ncbi:hypothetical protein ABBQ38_013179 [Trebouxia sp. C0009 RCD-2024]